MNYVEEQKNELEALSEIYYNEIKVISNEQPISFSIKVSPQASNYEQPEPTNDDDDNSDDSNEDQENIADEGLFVELQFEFTPEYPQTKPSLKIIDSNNLEEDELAELLDNLNQKIDESLGTVMTFMLVSEVVEWLSSRAEREANAIEREKQRKLDELEAEEKRKCEGTPVTVESFMIWKAKFDAEMLRLRLEEAKSRAATGAPKGLTGREMFETDKALVESDLNFVDDLEQGQIEALMQKIDDDVNLEDEDDDLDFDTDDDEDASSEDYDIEDKIESNSRG